MSMGVRKGSNRVDTAVTEMERAKFVLAKNDITFEARPLGQHPTRIMPAAISFGISG
jgi:hypothetical protein